MMKLGQFNTVWAISDGLPGHQRQAQALASALSQGAFETFHVSVKRPWSWLSPRLAFGAEGIMHHSFGTAWQSPPSLAIGCGRHAALATRLLHERGVQVVQILSPRIKRPYWDVLVVPEHDQIVGPRVVQTIASLHPIDDDWLMGKRGAYPEFCSLPQPRLALLLGGPTQQVCWTAADVNQLISELTDFLVQSHGSLMIVTSRRTPDSAYRQLTTVLRPFISISWSWGQATANPYDGVLAWADLIVVSCDSANLLSEACATRAAIVAAFSLRATGRFARLLDRLMNARGVLTQLPLWPIIESQQPLRETAQIAQKVTALLAQNDQP